MKLTSYSTYKDIDWSLLHRNALNQQGWKRRLSEDWDRKAKAFSNRNTHDTYVDLLLQHLPLRQNMTVLDVGCGPGTMAIPISEKVAAVTGIDFSKGMLDQLADRSKKGNRTNITPVCCSWDDDWDTAGIIPHDLAIASRALAVENLEACLQKLNKYGKRYVFLTDRIGDTPFEADAFRAIGRPFSSGPDYIYTLNTLYHLGIHANVSILTLDKEKQYPNIEAAFEAYVWMFPDLTKREQDLLRDYISSQIVHSQANHITVRRQSVPSWALLWWYKE